MFLIFGSYFKMQKNYAEFLPPGNLEYQTKNPNQKQTQIELTINISLCIATTPVNKNKISNWSCCSGCGDERVGWEERGKPTLSGFTYGTQYRALYQFDAIGL